MEAQPPTQDSLAHPSKNELLVVGVGSGPESEGLIRWTHRAAAQIGCDWIAIWVDDGRPLSAAERERLSRNIMQAQLFGAQVITAAGAAVAQVLLREANARHATQIVVGKSARRLPWRRTIADQLVMDSKLARICVVPSEGETEAGRLPAEPGELGPSISGRQRLKQYLIAVLLPFAIAASCWHLARVTGYMSVGMVFLLSVVLGAWKLGRGALLVLTTLSALVWDFFFIPPTFTIRIEKLEDVVIIAMFLILAVSMFASLLRNRMLVELRQRRQTATLLTVTQSAAFSVEPRKGLAQALHSINTLFHARTALVVRREDHTLPEAVHDSSTFQPAPEEWEVIRWCYKYAAPAGRFTGTFAHAHATWFPLQTATTMMGVLGVELPPDAVMDFNSRQMLDALSLQLALALEKEHFLRALQEAEVLQASEQLRHTLLDSVSHELKTPLAALQTATDELEHDPTSAARYLPELRAAQRRLRRTVENLLNMSRLESGAAKPVLEWCDVDQVCDAAIELVGDALEDHPFVMDVPVDLPMVRIDQALIEQALANLLINAGTHTPPGCEVALQARLQDRMLILSVLDRGPGLRPGENGRLFQKFARGESAPAGGSGLGLAIARGFASAHGGTATAAEREGGGTDFSLALPVETLQRDVHESGPTESAHH
jgi:two-component system sensor histidine kinase KdpD